MCDKTKDIEPQVSVNLTTDSDRVQAPVVGAGLADSGEGQSHVKQSLDLNNELDVFARRSSLARTPPSSRRGSVNNQSVNVSEETKNEQTQRRDIIPRTSPNRHRSLSTSSIVYDKKKEDLANPAKRKRFEATSPANETNQEDFHRLIEKILTKAHYMETLFKPNTNMEIKKTGMEIVFTVQKLKKLNSEAKSIRKDHQEQMEICHQRPTVKTVEASTQTDFEPNVKQTGAAEDANAKKEEEKYAQQIRAKIDKCNNFEDFKEVMEKRWPRSVFRRVREETGDILAAPWELDLALPTTSDLELSKGIARRFKERFGGIEQLKKQKESLGGVAYLENSITVPTDEGLEKQSRFVWYMFVEKEPAELASIEAVYKTACKLKTFLIKHQRFKIAIPSIATYKQGILEKTLEYVFKDTDIEIYIYRQPRRHGSDKDAKSTDNAQRKGDEKGARPFKKEAIIVRTNGQSYADLVKRLRNEVSLDGIPVEVSKMRQTRNGDVVVEISNGKAEDLKTTISNKLQGVQISKRTQETVIHLKEMDAATTEEEIKEALNKVLGNKEDFRITSLRPAYRGTQNATIILNNKLADTLIRMKKIKIGWTICHIRERKTEQRCRQCWNSGHNESECKGPNRKDLCRKCAQKGHMAKNCKNSPFCLDCNTEGHQTGATRCGRRARNDQQHS